MFDPKGEVQAPANLFPAELRKNPLRQIYQKAKATEPRINFGFDFRQGAQEHTREKLTGYLPLPTPISEESERCNDGVQKVIEVRLRLRFKFRQ